MCPDFSSEYLVNDFPKQNTLKITTNLGAVNILAIKLNPNYFCDDCGCFDPIG